MFFERQRTAENRSSPGNQRPAGIATIATPLLKAILPLICATSVLMGTAGCAPTGGAMALRTATPAESHRLQKIAAKNFKKDWPATESVRFTGEGSYSASGQWAANAIVTIAGREYQEIMGPWTLGGDGLPEADSDPRADALTVHYYDGQSEVVR